MSEGEINLTQEQATRMLEQHARVEAGECDLSDLIMPDGRLLKDCTAEYIVQVAHALQLSGSPTSASAPRSCLFYRPSRIHRTTARRWPATPPLASGTPVGHWPDPKKPSH
jgi:hypothetical protein